MNTVFEFHDHLSFLTTNIVFHIKINVNTCNERPELPKVVVNDRFYCTDLL